jgi:hypothetical protein
MKTEELRKSLRDKWYQYINNNAETSYSDYQDEVKKLADKYPKQFAEIRTENTDANIAQRNQVHMAKEVMPFDAAIADSVEQRATVPYGFERNVDFGTVAGLFDIPAKKINLAGEGNTTVGQHEGLHSIMSDWDNSEGIKVKPKGTVASEEYVVRLNDIARGVLTDNPDLVEQATSFIKDQGYRETSNHGLMQHLAVALRDVADNIGLSEEDARRLAQSYEDRNGFIFDYEGTSWMPTTMKGQYNKERVQEIVDTAPQGTVSQEGFTTYINLDKTGLEPTIK